MKKSAHFAVTLQDTKPSDDIMNQDWQEFLIQQGALLQDGLVDSFGNFQSELLAARDGTIICDLSQFGTLKVSGEEAQKFLQNLLSNDIDGVNAVTAQFSSFNSAKGRMLASLLIWQQGADYYVQLPRSLTAAIFKKLTMYVLRSKVKISDASDEIVCLGIAGNTAQTLVKQHLNVELQQDNAVTQLEQATVIRVAENRYLLSTSAQYAQTMWSALATSTTPAGSACWDWLNIRAAIPVITPPTQEQFVLQMTNLDILNGVSFKKGCYPGQEIVARTHYLGKQKRRMFLAHVETEISPEAGNEVFSEDMPQQPCGMVINASKAPGSGFDLLAVMQISSHDTQKIHLQSSQGTQLHFLPLPYAIPASE
ncbi:MAG: YgfZ/GcvT domain-containing protein [Gallionellaceae bacterium]